MEFKETGYERVELIHVAQDRVQWRAFVSIIINLQVPYKASYFLSTEIPAFEKCSPTWIWLMKRYVADSFSWFLLKRLVNFTKTSILFGVS